MDITIYNLKLDDDKHPALIREQTIKYGCGKFTDPDKVVQLCNAIIRMRYFAEEQMWMLALNSKGYFLGLFPVSHGSVNLTVCQPREVYIRALAVGAVGIILIHNHPSGDCQPSEEDELCCKRILEAGKLLGIALSDFIIVGNDEYYSFLEQGDIK